MGYCHHCNNTGWIDCHCGGDLCVCENNGEEPCFYCDGGMADDDYLEEDDDGKVVDVGDELHQALADALAKNKSTIT